MTPNTYRTSLDRTRATILNSVAKGATIRAKRSLQLVDRYNELRAALRSISPDAWHAYCASFDACPSHDGHDLFA